MSTATLTPPASTTPPPAAAPRLAGLVDYVEPGKCLLATGVSYADYMQLAEWRDEVRRRSVRLTFDRGDLEIMVVTNPHERFWNILGLLIQAWLEETGGDYLPSGQLTHRREDLDRGFEPDACYYIQNWQAVAGRCEIDFTKDPPPDLAVEAEVSRTVLGRLPLYAAFKVPEVWRYDGERLIVLLLQPDGSYQESSLSRALPTIPLSALPQFLAMEREAKLSFAEISRRFREWIRSLPSTEC